MRLVVDRFRDARRRPPPLTSGLRRPPESRNCTSMVTDRHRMDGPGTARVPPEPPANR